MLASNYSENAFECGCDEAGRGCLAGPVIAAAVVFPRGYQHPLMNDSKKLTPALRQTLRKVIEKDALAYAIAKVEVKEIDQVNILNASILAMHKAIGQLQCKIDLLLIDGNRFKPYQDIPHACVVKGDQKLISIAAASILAKTERDAYMQHIGAKFPQYGWQVNKGYGTLKHREAILQHGITSHHRKSFRLIPEPVC